jgi:surface antigen
MTLIGLVLILALGSCATVPGTAGPSTDPVAPSVSEDGVFVQAPSDDGEKEYVLVPVTTYDPLVMQMSDGTKRINPTAGSLSELQARVLVASHNLLGTKPNANVTIRGRTYVCDCIGTVAAIFYDAGIDIWTDLGAGPGWAGGVDTLYEILEARDTLHRNLLPAVGDVVFWDDTYDSNGDGTIGNDPKTHVGIVVKVEKDGTIHYLHENYYTGIVVERMNLFRPEVHRDPVTGKLLNSPMYDGSYAGNPNNPENWLAGDLWNKFGGVLRLVDPAIASAD